jgi:hypothetical protein
MSKSYRIKTTPGQDNGYLKVNVDLNQNYDQLEILSLKIGQLDDYQSYCSEYGVIAGRVEINDGFGVPNVKVSIFVPVEDVDLENPVISSLYPYQTPFPDEKNISGIRYNLLPKNKQTLDHTPVGTFPKKREILDDSTTLEIYEKYYKYTTTTNEAGDYILFGVPVGDHLLHYDCDLSDIGFISSRPYEMISQGYSEDLFDNNFKFKDSNNLDTLSQIISQNIPVTVEPFWCDSLSVGSPLGINRYDISIPYEVTPTAIFMGSIFSDDEKDSLNKNCKPNREMGKMNEVITGNGSIEAIRRNVDGGIETFNFNDDTIDENGNWSVLVPMNIRKVVTDEFGNLIPSPDGIKGVATEGDYRFRISMDATGNDKRLRQRAKFLVPNTNNNFNFGEYSQEDLKNSTEFTLNEQLSTITDNTPYENDITNQYNYLEEFYSFRWKKVYTVKQYIGRYQKTSFDEARGFIGIKDIINSEGVNKFPSNRMDTNVNILYGIICLILNIFGLVVGIINAIIMILNGLITMICQVRIPIGLCGESVKKARIKMDYDVYVPNNNNDGWTFDEEEKSDDWSSLIDMDYVSEGDFDIESTGLDLTPSDLEEYFYDGYNNGNLVSNFSPFPSFLSLNGWAALNSNDYTANGQTNGNVIGRYPQGGGSAGGGGTGALSPLCNGVDQNCFCPKGAPFGDNSTQYCYNFGSCYNHDLDSITYPDVLGACRKWRFAKNNNMGDSISSADKQTDDVLKQECKDTEGSLYFLGKCWKLKFKCLFSGLFCKKCQPSCPEGEPHSCCPADNYGFGCEDANGDTNNAAQCGNNGQCCCDCCIKIPLIPLKCADENKEWLITTILPTPFAAAKCNKNYVVPFSCVNCGGLQTPGIKDWIACILEPLAVWLKMLKFDFYNDWVGGTLYFPLVKRKYKLKKSKRKFGQIKKDKFCDYDCRIRNSTEYQGDPTYKQWRIKIPSFPFSNPSIELGGCKHKLKGKRVTEWYGTLENDAQTPNLDLAVQDFNFPGTNGNGDGCTISFDTFSDFQNTFNSLGINFSIKNHDVYTEHGKPEYIQIDDGNGNTSWENIGGHAHFRNVCNNTRLIERKEYFKTSLDCDGPVSATDIDNITSEGIGLPPEDVDNDETNPEDFQGCTINDNIGEFCRDNDCDPDCGSNGVAPCKNTSQSEVQNYNGSIIEHGLISWRDQEIYYTPRILPNVGDTKFNDDEYKGNLLLPTTIMELGSSVYCDIDDVPFIMDQLEPTTFNLSFEDTKYRSKVINTSYPGLDGVTGNDDDGTLREFTKFQDKKDSSLNLRAYVEFGCFSVVCSNTLATVNQSQIGVEMIDKNDIGVEIGNCFVRFDHDEDIRSYFCRRFNGFKGDSTFHYTRPGSIEFDNDYQTYEEITLSDGFNLYYELPETGEIVKSEYNDGDSFIPGDACGYYNTNGSSDYFYGLAPGQTSSFINYPNTDNSGGDSGTINFGLQAHPGNVDEIFTGTVDGELDEDINNGASNINGIRFNRSQTPYHLYFGLVPGKTSLQKTVGKFFADKINAVTLQGLESSNDQVSENIINSPNLNNPVDNRFTVYKTCLGETLIQDEISSNTTPSGPGTIGGGGPIAGTTVGTNTQAG